jgi:hypothetical protein
MVFRKKQGAASAAPTFSARVDVGRTDDPRLLVSLHDSTSFRAEN